VIGAEQDRRMLLGRLIDLGIVDEEAASEARVRDERDHDRNPSKNAKAKLHPAENDPAAEH